jgi:hypothetical protein
VFLHIKEATLILCFNRCLDQHFNHVAPADVAKMRRVIERFISKAPKLRDLRVACYQLLMGSAFIDGELPQEVLSATDRKKIEFLPILPDTLTGLPCVQRGEGYRVGFAFDYEAEKYRLAPN